MDQKIQMKKEVTEIFRFNERIDYTSTDEVSEAISFFKNNKLNQTPVGKKYVSKLQDIVDGKGTASSCVICNQATKHGMVCNACKAKLSKLVGAGAKTTLKQPQAEPKQPQAKPKPSATHKEPSQQKESGAGSGQIDPDAVRKMAGDAAAKAKEVGSSAKKRINDYKKNDLGDLKFRDMFSGVFKRHSKEESEELFVCGTSKTTPDLRDISSGWPRPWLFSRILVVMFAAFYLLLLCWRHFANPNVLPGIMFLGSCMIPISILVFYFEMNVPRNISLIETFRIFLLGGCMSLLITLILFEVMPNTDFTVPGAILIGFIEEYGKIFIVAWFIKRLKGRRFILNGMLIGAAIGTGFAAFESAGYAFRVYSYLNFDAMLENIYMRGVLSPGGHIAWAAFSGAALVIVMKQEKFAWKYLFDKKFLCMVIVPIGFHAVWDMSSVLQLGEIGIFPIKQIILSVCMCLVNFVLLSRGLKEINKL